MAVISTRSANIRWLRWILLRFFACLMLPLAQGACSSKTPSESRPWTVVLFEAESKSEAELVAQELAVADPLLEGSSTFVSQDDDVPRFLVLSPAFPLAEQAQGLQASLQQKAQSSLEVLSFSTLRPGSSNDWCQPPQDAQEIRRMAGFLPGAPQGELQSFYLNGLPTKAQAPTQGPIPDAWSTAMQQLGTKSFAQAWYQVERQGKISAMQVWILWPKKDDPDALQAAFHRLHELRHPVPPILTPPLPARKIPVGSAEEVPLAPIGDDLLEPAALSMPWGPTPTYLIDSLTGPWSAMLAWTPAHEAVLVAIFNDLEYAKMRLAPRGMPKSKGLATAGALKMLWCLLPANTVDKEQLSALGMVRSELWWSPQKPACGSNKADSQVQMASYLSDQRFWTFWHLQTGAPADAACLYDRVLVTPRREMIQKVLRAAKKTLYPVGVRLREINDTEGWQLLGAGQGKLQELYFFKDNHVVLLQAPLPASTQSKFDDLTLVEKAKTLRIWEAKKS